MKRIFCFTIFVLWSSAAAQTHFSGLVFDSSAYDSLPLTAPLTRGSFVGLPPSASLLKYCPPAGNQGISATCVGWAVAYGARTILEGIRAEESASHASSSGPFSPFFVYNQIKSFQGCASGTNVERALVFLRDHGASPMKAELEVCDATISEEHREIARRFRIDDFKRLFVLGADNEKVVLTKKSISERKPVILVLHVPGSFLQASELWTTSETDTIGRSTHAVVAIGYDDDHAGGTIHILNSWGDQWGNRGTTTIRYDDFARVCLAAYEMILVRDPSDLGVTLSARMELRNADDEPMRVISKEGRFTLDRSYPSGTRFRILLDNRQPAYVYVLSTDTSGVITHLFPFDTTISAYLGYAGSGIAIPDERHFIALDDAPGVDTFCFVYSTHALSLTSMTDRPADSHEGIDKRLSRVLGKGLVPENDIHVDTSNGVDFTVQGTHGSIVMITVDIPHSL